VEYSNRNNGVPPDDKAQTTESKTESVPEPKPLEFRPPEVPATQIPKQELFNRDLSWLEFNRRVLSEALDIRTPLLERLRFLGIFNSNLDEFFMKRVGGLRRQVAAGIIAKSHEGYSPAELLKEIRAKVVPMLQDQAAGFLSMIPLMRENNIQILSWNELTPAEVEYANKHFKENVFPVLTPLAVDPGHPFPFLSNLSISLAVALTAPGQEEKLFARVKIPQAMPAVLQLPGDAVARFIRLQDIVIANLDKIFPRMIIQGVMPFRVTRNIEIERDEEDAEDLLEMIEEELRLRRFARIVRVEHGPKPDLWIRNFIISELELTEDEIYELPAELDYSAFRPIAELPVAKLKYEPWIPVVPLPLIDQETSIFSIIKKNDILLHHPYDSFSASIERFIQSASEDPKVVGIKMTLYRTDENSTFIKSLVRAAESGKQVVCLVELKARFDEARNISWAQTLEDAGAHVVYGIVGLKTHSKLALVIRQEPDGLKSYVHVGTGNYHSGTARAYTDFGLLTTNSPLSEDVVELFHYLTGRSMKTDYSKLLVAPVQMKERFIQMIEREIKNKSEGKPAQIIAKMNSLEDQSVIRALYKASQAGVEIDLIVRGFCSLLPKVPSLSPTIRVLAIVGRFLEHSRAFYFRNGQKDPVAGEFYIGSADWMFRNLIARVEAVAPIEDKVLKERLWEIIQICLSDHRQVWEMNSDGTYTQRKPQNEAQSVGLHQLFMKSARQRSPPGVLLAEEEAKEAKLQKGESLGPRSRTTRKSRRKK
jgi:polyphosphate kinase